MSLWKRTYAPLYVNTQQHDQLYYDASGYWIVRYYAGSLGIIRNVKELLVTISNIDKLEMYRAGISHIGDYSILSDDTASYYLATPDGNPIFIEV